MTQHPALARDHVAVVTGAASGIGLAAARRFAEYGMRVLLSDSNADALARAAEGLPGARAQVADVSRREDVEALRESAFAMGPVSLLMNNAGTAPGGGPWDHYDRWQRVLGVNLWGVINGVQSFAPAMIAQGIDAAIVNTGSKQGITCPPGDTAYNVSKAGVKVLTEALAHSLRETPDCRVSAFLLVPGSTFTGMTAPGATEKPAGMWTADQVIDELLHAMQADRFYVICPDNEVTREVDNLRIRWAAQDITEDRPPLSRWHPQWRGRFAEWLEQSLQQLPKS